MKQKTLIEKIRDRKALLERQVDRLELSEKNYESNEDNLSKHGLRSWGKITGRVLAKEMEISFLEELIAEEEGKHGSSEGTV